MKRLQRLASTTLGKKAIAAITGIILFGFLVGHVAGNLKVFTGSIDSETAPAIDEYAHFLRVLGHPLVPDEFVLWSARLVLLVSFVVHIVVVAQLALLNQSARPIKYARSRKIASTPAALWMMVSGSMLLVFVVFHILHLTTGTIRVGDFEHGLVYQNLYNSFSLSESVSNLLVVLFYLVSMVGLGFHLWHGVWSLFQTLGLDNPDRNQLLRWFATGITVILVVGFALVPLAFMMGGMAEPIEYDAGLLEAK